MNEGFIGFMIWLLSSCFCLFNPQSPFGKKVIFCSWILGPCRLISLFLLNTSIPILGVLSGMTAIGMVAAIVIAYMYGERAVDRLNPNASRIKYIVIGFLSSVLLMPIISTLFHI